MFDETNKTDVQDFELPEKLFESDEPMTDGNAEPTATDDANHGTTEEKNGGTIRIKYNGEERDITLDEARVLAQKGMNYDHVVSERDTKYIRELRALDKAAEKLGMTRAQYMQSIESEGENNANVESGVSESAQTRAREQINRISESLGFRGPWANLFRKYPDLSRSEAFSQLSADVGRGMTPLEAYQAKLIGERERELAIAKNNNAASAKAIGSLEGERSGGGRDEFLEGFFTDY